MTELVIRSSAPPPISAHLSPAGLAASLWRHRALIRSFSSREVLERHKGALLGIGWNVASPLLALGVYTLVFGYIFGQRWGKGGLPEHLDFPLTYFAGAALYGVFAEAMGRGPTIVSGKPNLVRKVVFPLEILPVTVVHAGVVHALVSIGVLLGVLAAVTGGAGVHPTIALLPLVLLPLVLLSVGVAWTLSAVGVFIRDLRPVTVVLTQLLMFCTPLFYTVDRIPEDKPWLRWIIVHNPLSVIVESGRRVLLWGETPEWGRLGWTTLAGLLAAVGGHAVFSALRRSMADVH
jgi:lipopolysaccharide transport system permease protein